MVKKTNPSFATNKEYKKGNIKYANKNMFMSDNETDDTVYLDELENKVYEDYRGDPSKIEPKRIILEDDKTRTEKHREEWTEKVKLNEKRYDREVELGVPTCLLEFRLEEIQKIKIIANMTYREYVQYYAQAKKEQKERERIEELKAKEYRKNNPMNLKLVKLIYEKFDMWLEKYKDDPDILEDISHRFFEGWIWGSIAPFSEKEFYEMCISKEDAEFCLYSLVFDVCENMMLERLKELKPEYFESKRKFA